MVYWFFGQPGAGKSYVANRFAQTCNYVVVDADDFHTAADRDAVRTGSFTLARRHAQLKRVIGHLMAHGMRDVVVTHPLPDQRSRTLVEEISEGESLLVHIVASTPLQLRRLQQRTGHHFTAELLEPWIGTQWEEPENGRYWTIHNGDSSGELDIQLTTLLENSHNKESRGKK